MQTVINLDFIIKLTKKTIRRWLYLFRIQIYIDG